MSRIATPPMAAPPRSAPTRKTFGKSTGIVQRCHKIVLYGTGGIGKSELASRFPGIVFADIERSAEHMNVSRVNGIEDWADLRAWAQSPEAAQEKAICIDSATKAEEWCAQHIIKTVPHEKGHKVDRIEDFGYGKGYSHTYEEWRRFLGDLENLSRKGVNVVMICHEQVAKVPNPTGEDFQRYQPRLQTGEKSNSLAATKEWADHVLFISYDVAVKDGKGRGTGTRAIYTTETPTQMAKSRTLPPEPIAFEKGSTALWDLMLGKKSAAIVADDAPPAD